MKNCCKEHDDILIKIRRLSKLLHEDFDNRLEAFGLTSTQGRVLFFIYAQNKFEDVVINQKDIENQFKLSKSTVSELLSRMEKKHLIQRIQDPPRCRIQATKEGEELVDNVHKTKTKTIKKLFSNLSKEERIDLTNKLDKLITNMEGGNKHA